MKTKSTFYKSPSQTFADFLFFLHPLLHSLRFEDNCNNDDFILDFQIPTTPSEYQINRIFADAFTRELFVQTSQGINYPRKACELKKLALILWNTGFGTSSVNIFTRISYTVCVCEKLMDLTKVGAIFSSNDLSADARLQDVIFTDIHGWWEIGTASV